MLTDFGSRWKEGDVGRRRKGREEVVLGEQKKTKVRVYYEKKVGEYELEAKEEQPEEERPVPGMNGLTVEFVKNILSIGNNNTNSGDGDGESTKDAGAADDNRDEIYSDRLPFGRCV